MKRTIFVILVALVVSRSAWAGFGDIFNGVMDRFLGNSENATSLSKDEISRGIREALRTGAERAVESASGQKGFTANPDIHIPLPEGIASIADKLRYVGLSGQVDTFESTMNTAAEKASKKAMPIVAEAITTMSMEDVREIWKGGGSSATKYLREQTRKDIYREFLPVVSKQTRSVGATDIYKNLTDNPAVRGMISGTRFDLDHYVTEKTMEGLFHLLGREEQKIRSNPAARTSDILEKVFGSGN